jgi:E3 ubiquitin-protein ligase HERC4
MIMQYCFISGTGSIENNDMHSYPKMIKALATSHVIQITCGYNHSLALTQSECHECCLNRVITSTHHMYTFQCIYPRSMDGVLPFARLFSVIVYPTPLILAQVKCLSYFWNRRLCDVVLFLDGALYSWGCNTYGQLGLGNKTGQLKPSLITSLAGIPIAFISCGGNHSFAVSRSGKLHSYCHVTV